MRRWPVWSLWLVLLLPAWSTANDLGPLATLAPVGNAIVAAAYLFGGAGVVWCATHIVTAYRDRDMGGLMPVFSWVGVTVLAAILLGTIVPGMVAPILARGATL